MNDEYVVPVGYLLSKTSIYR